MDLSRVRIPEPTDRVYKNECCISFETPRSEGGLYVDLNSFLAFGKEYVMWNYDKTKNPVYLHIQQRKKPLRDYRPLKKRTLVAIGVEGGFNSQEPEYEETYSIIILPHYISHPFPSVELPKKVRLAVNAILLSERTERKDQIVSCTTEKKKNSAYALDLPQINNGVIMPPSGWKCCKCDESDNLWLNLTDGVILCGRRNEDGTSGNNHAFEHYKETGYPLAVKLGSITADLEAADVFSYPEDDSVEDPLLAQHLAFFGIDFSSLQKTEMTTAERVLNQSTNFDWNRIQQSGQITNLLFGPGYTGLTNLGDSCYIASVMQVVFSTHPFILRHYIEHSLKEAFDLAPEDPTLDLNTQLTKLGHGLLSGKYSIPGKEVDVKGSCSEATSSAKQEGIPPHMFKSVVAGTHPEFSSMRQQCGNIEKARDWIFTHPEETYPVPTSTPLAVNPRVPDGSGRYKLVAIVSHIGTSTHYGHYVAYVLKNEKWVIFNDNEVAVSVPPKDMGYLYFFKREQIWLSSDVGGFWEIQETIKELIDLKRVSHRLYHFPFPFHGTQLNVLCGPRGRGKSHIMHAIAAAASIACVSVAGGELMKKCQNAPEEDVKGVVKEAVDELLVKAFGAAPSILFFDDFDCFLTKKRNYLVPDLIMCQIISVLQYIEDSDGVLVFAATHQPRYLHLQMPPDRLGKILHVNCPDWEERLDILRVLSQKLRLDAGVDFRTVASMTAGFSGADLERLLSTMQLGSIVINRRVLRALILEARPSLLAERNRPLD